jgi:AraC-like DNA-binding protein
MTTPPHSADAIRVSPFILTWPRLLGIATSELARASSIPLSRLESASDLSYEETLSIWAALEELTQDPVVGLHAGARFTIDQMGVVGPALAHATHLDAALDVLVRIMRVFVKNADITRVDSADAAGIRYCMPTLRSRHGVDTIFAATLALVRHCTARHLVPQGVDHQMPRVADSAYVAFFGVTPRWNAEACQLCFKRADLALPFRGASPQLAALLAEHVPQLMAHSSQETSFERDLENAFWKAHHDREATLESTALVLGISARTLQRKLGAMKTTFAEERARILHQHAELLLRERALPIETIATRLGYSNRAAFERAFLRWSGKTPHAVRSGS